jgi:hypothetical protein
MELTVFPTTNNMLTMGIDFIISSSIISSTIIDSNTDAVIFDKSYLINVFPEDLERLFFLIYTVFFTHKIHSIKLLPTVLYMKK